MDANSRSIPSFFRCTTCHWFGNDPSSRETTERHEFWGQITSELFHELECPDCGGDVDEAHACLECHEHAVDVEGSDYCSRCLAQIEREDEEAVELASESIDSEMCMAEGWA